MLLLLHVLSIALFKIFGLNSTNLCFCFCSLMLRLTWSRLGRIWVFYPSMIHITCFAHALHRVCEQVREMFKEVNDLISAVKKVFLKAPSRIKIWKEHCGFLPPDSMLTRWGTWIAILCFPLWCCQDNPCRTRPSRSCCNWERTVTYGKWRTAKRSGLHFFQFGLSTILLEATWRPGLSLEESLRLFDGVRVNIEEIAGERGEVLKRKFNTVVARNPDLALLRKILGAMQGTANVPESVKVADISSYKFCLLLVST